MSRPNHVSDRVLTVPSAMASSIAAVNASRSSASPLRNPTATPRPSTPPESPGPTIVMSANSGFCIVAVKAE